MQALLEARQKLQGSEGEAKNAVERSRAANERAADLGRSIGQLEMLLDDAVERRQAAEQRAAEAEAMLKALTAVEEYQGYCPWCGRYVITKSHQDGCSWQAATAWLEAGDRKE